MGANRGTTFALWVKNYLNYIISTSVRTQVWLHQTLKTILIISFLHRTEVWLKISITDA
jgi:hypothetical protein